jgi:hypothetical protein
VRPARTQSKVSPDLPPRQQGTCSAPNRAGPSFLILRHALVYSNVLKAVEMGKMTRHKSLQQVRKAVRKVRLLVLAVSGTGQISIFRTHMT